MVTTAEAKEHGLHPNALLNRARSGVLERVDRGVYLVRGSADTPARRAIVACRRAGTAALLSHRAGGLHWTLDMAMREDDSRIRTDHAPANMAVLRHIALNLIRLDKTRKAGIKASLKKAGWDTRYLEKLLGMAVSVF